MIAKLTPLELDDVFTDVGRQLAGTPDRAGALQTLAEIAVARVPGAEYAGVTAGRRGRMSTVAATDDLVRAADAIQYELMSGPCVDAIIQNTTFNAADLRTDVRWPEFGRRVVEATGISSMLALRMFFETDDGLVAALNLFSRQTRAFGPDSEAMGVLLATHGALALASAAARQQNSNLEIALRSSREIGISVGVLMALHKINREQAFDLLVIASQRTHRKVTDLAREVADTGTLPTS